MFEAIQKDLDILYSSSKIQSVLIKTLFLSCNEIVEQKQFIIYPFNQIHDNFLRIRPEVAYQIVSFLTFEEYLQFRLVGKRQNFIVRYNVALKLKEMNNSIEQLKSTIEEYQHKLEEKYKVTDQIEKQKAEVLDPLNQLNLQDLVELKRCKVHAQVAPDIVNFILILLDPNYKETKILMEECNNFFNDSTILQKLVVLDPISISDQQLVRLSSLEYIAEAQFQKVSNGYLQFYRFLKNIINLRRTKIYEFKYNINLIQLQITTKNKQIERLKKIELI